MLVQGRSDSRLALSGQPLGWLGRKLNLYQNTQGKRLIICGRPKKSVL